MSTMNKSVSIIIPNYNGKNLLQTNLPFIEKARKYSKNRIIEIIVVDDYSTDGSVEFLKKYYSNIKLIKHRKNRGFSSSVNTGVRTAKGDLVVLLNSDVIPSYDFVFTALADFESEMVFGVSFNEEGYSWAKAKFVNGYVEHEPGYITEQTHPSFWVNGGSGIFRRNVWIEIGGMDEILLNPFYWEDIDLSYRAQKRGYITLWEPKAKVIHKHEGTIGSLPKKYVQRVRERNELLFIWKNITSASLFKKHLAGLAGRVIKHPGYSIIVLMALAKILKVISARRKEQKESTVSDEAIFSRYK